MMLLLPLGEDVDTVCAVYGQIAGACFGYENIPSRWINKLQQKQKMLDPLFGSLVNMALK
jgi:ADP-ribosyl-[dinitrogen reductase] hydrolase